MKFTLLNGIHYIVSIRYKDTKQRRKLSNVYLNDRAFNRKRTIYNQSRKKKFTSDTRIKRSFYRLHKWSYSDTTLDHISYKSNNNQEELQI